MSSTPATSRRHVRGFWLVATTLLVLMGAAGAPSPLFVVYQARWHFSPAGLTTAFAVYALALLVALLTTGALSDDLGRRPVLAVGLLLDAAAMVAFLVADGLGGLVAARVLQGVGTGVAIGVVSAALVDLEPPARDGRPRVWSSGVVNSVAPTLGLGLGAVASGLVVDLLPSPTTVVFTGLGVSLAALAVLLVAVPETVERRAGALGSLRPRVRVPQSARVPFVASVPVMLATWAIGGLYLSLGPSLAAQVLGLHRHVVGGVVVATLMLSGAVTVLASRERAPRQVLLGGTAVLALGTVVTLASLDTASTVGYFVGTAIAGAGFGSAFSGTLRTIAPTVGPHERAELFAALYLVSYLGFSVPAVLAGVAAGRVGLLPTATTYGVVVVLLALSALGLTWRAQSTARRAARA
ncbi:MFS transporter [Angustibacter peucedani]